MISLWLDKLICPPSIHHLLSTWGAASRGKKKKHFPEHGFTCYPSASIAAEGEHQHMAQGPHSVTDTTFFIDIVLTLIKGVKCIINNL